MTSQPHRSSKLSNFFGGVGYISVISQWLWTIALVLPSLLQNESIKGFLLPQQTVSTQTPSALFDENSVILIIAAVIVTALVLVVTVVVIIRLPIAIVRTSQKTVASTVEIIIPTLTHHKPVSKKKRALLSTKIRIYIKLVLSVLPLMPLTFIGSDAIGLDQAIALLVGATLAIGSTIWFILQYSTAKLLKIPFDKLL